VLLNEVKTKKMLKEAGISVTDTRLATSKQEAITLSEEIGFPVVLKIVSPDISHKSDSGGVKLDLNTAEQVGNAYYEILNKVSKYCPAAEILGISVQKMAPPGVEIIIGVSQDEQFGPVIMFGLGGTMTELFKDVAFRVLPVTETEADDMIKEIKGYRLLSGFRGKPPVDISALKNMALDVSRFIAANPGVSELDLNPVFAYPNGSVAVDARLILEDKDITPMTVEKEERRSGLDFMFYPKSLALVGASNNPNSRGYDFMMHLINFGYKGEIYPLSLKNPEIMGVKAYPSLDDVPGDVEHVIYCIALEHLPSFLDSAVRKGVKSVHIFSARGSETGRAESKALEAEILKKARQYGIRLLGPNCMGVYCPETGFSFCTDFPKEKGNVGAMIQSGGSSTDITRFGALRGLRFSKVVSYGNALDINELDLLKYFSDDPQTNVIIAFIEGLKSDGREFLELVRKTSAKKPFIVCKGGKSKAGARSTMSHTASMAKSSRVWDIAIRQAGGIPVRDLDDLIHMAVGFSFIPPIKGKRLGTGGSGGGRNTVSVDEWEDNGFEVVPLPQGIREEFKRRGAELWYCLDNPADRSISVPGDPFTVPTLLMEMAKHPDFDFICANVAPDDHPYNQETFVEWIGSTVNGYVTLHRESPKPFFLIFSERPLGIADMDYWFWREVAHLRTKIIDAGVPFFPTVDKAAEVLNAMIAYQRWLSART
jgi:acyl-CoA synthetase (NDP forming)